MKDSKDFKNRLNDELADSKNEYDKLVSKQKSTTLEKYLKQFLTAKNKKAKNEIM